MDTALVVCGYMDDERFEVFPTAGAENSPRRWPCVCVEGWQPLQLSMVALKGVPAVDKKWPFLIGKADLIGKVGSRIEDITQLWLRMGNSKDPDCRRMQSTTY